MLQATQLGQTYDLWHLPGPLSVINPPATGLKSVAPGMQISGTVH